jgi:hypothetical protein
LTPLASQQVPSTCREGGQSSQRPSARYRSAASSIELIRGGQTIREAGMQVIGLFAVLVLVLNVIGVGICSIIESYSPYAGLLAFLGFFVVNFIIAWKVALYLTERFLLTSAQREENDRLSKALKSPYGYRA